MILDVCFADVGGLAVVDIYKFIYVRREGMVGSPLATERRVLSSCSGYLSDGGERVVTLWSARLHPATQHCTSAYMAVLNCRLPPAACVCSGGETVFPSVYDSLKVPLACPDCQISLLTLLPVVCMQDEQRESTVTRPPTIAFWLLVFLSACVCSQVVRPCSPM
jgi:hypothetical protein